MKPRMLTLLFAGIIILVGGCAESVSEKSKNYKIVPDNTPLIMGLIEASDDTIHHFSELIVGYVRDKESAFDPAIFDDIPELYNPTLWSQVVNTLKRFHLSFRPEERAEVTVSGPLKKPSEKKVTYAYLGEGIYGDQNYDLIVRSGEEYLLKVALSDGRKYLSKTVVPEQISVRVPDSIGLEVEYKPYEDGTPREESIKNYYINFEYPVHTYLTELQSNSNLDRETLLLKPEEAFLFEDRGPFLRSGSLYAILMTSNNQDSLRRRWGQDLNKPREEVWNKRKFWMRFSFFSDGVGGNFFPMINIFTSKGERWDQLSDRFVEAYESQDSTYLFEVSTIRKDGKDGKVLPKDSSDAIGFFGGYFSIYRTTTLYPIRTFDLDSVLSEYEN